MSYTKSFFQHIQHVTGIMARAPEPTRYPYHDWRECPVGRKVKKSGDWQYYLGRPGEERARCSQCAELAAAATAAGQP